MQELFTKKAKKIIGIAALTCFLTTPVSYTMNISSAAAAALDNQIQFEQRHDPPGRGNGNGDRNNEKKPNNIKKPSPSNDISKRNNDKKRPAQPPRKDNNNKSDKDKKRPAPPPRNDRNDRWDRDKDRTPPPPKHNRDDDDKDFDRGDITTAVLIGGVIGAIIAKNT